MKTVIPLREIFDTWANWLMTPVRAARRTKQRLVFRALRSRLFLVVALASALPILITALAATYNAAHERAATTTILVLLWAVAILTWALFFVTVAYHHWRFSGVGQKSGNGA
jgi:ABC-type siderophore export system fused ATPase/permease subunit